MLKGRLISKRKKKIRKERMKEYIKDITDGKFSKLYVSDAKIAEIIIRWCEEEENPTEFFLRCLSIMGVHRHIAITDVSESENEYSFILREKQKEMTLFVSKTPKEYLGLGTTNDKKICYYVSREKGRYKILNYNFLVPVLIIGEEKITIEYCLDKTIKILVGKYINIVLSGYEWNMDKSLYFRAKSMIKDLKKIDEVFTDPYLYYCEIKGKIDKYFKLQGVKLELSKDEFSMTTENGKLIEYIEPALGIIIKNYYNKGYFYKEYRSDGIHVEWKDGYIKIPERDYKNIKQYVDIAKGAIEKVEMLEF